MRTLFLTLGQRLRVDRAKPRAAGRIDHRHYDLRTARRVVHDPIENGTGAGDAHEVTYRDGLHHPSLPSASRPTLGNRSHRRADRQSDRGSLKVVNDLVGA